LNLLIGCVGAGAHQTLGRLAGDNPPTNRSSNEKNVCRHKDIKIGFHLPKSVTEIY